MIKALRRAAPLPAQHWFNRYEAEREQRDEEPRSRFETQPDLDDRDIRTDNPTQPRAREA